MVSKVFFPSFPPHGSCKERKRKIEEMEPAWSARPGPRWRRTTFPPVYSSTHRSPNWHANVVDMNPHLQPDGFVAFVLITHPFFERALLMWDESAGLTLADGSGRGLCASAAFHLVIRGKLKKQSGGKCHRNVRASRARIRSRWPGSGRTQSLLRRELLFGCSSAWTMPRLYMWYDIIGPLPGWTFQGQSESFSPTSHAQITRSQKRCIMKLDKLLYIRMTCHGSSSMEIMLQPSIGEGCSMLNNCI